jgi:predicted transcriptional regulator
MSTFLVYPTDEQEKIVKAFLEALEISFIKDDDEELPPHVLAGIARGQADIAAGRFITFEEFKERFPVK